MIYFVKVRVLFFAKSRELVGSSEAELDVPASVTADALKDTILQAYPG